MEDDSDNDSGSGSFIDQYVTGDQLHDDDKGTNNKYISVVL